jgi:nicotinate-nucleotide pyrophosphorylase (carboxylating)
VSEQLAALVALALHEDLEHGGDITSAATIPETARSRADIVARAAGVAAGLATVRAVLDQIDPDVSFEAFLADGDVMAVGDVLGRLEGATRSLLAAERTILNFLTHLSGVATATARYVEELAGTRCALRDTRKTTPGMRDLEKAAVAAGGGANHRMGLFDALLVKDNHVVAAGGVGLAARAALAWVDHSGRDLPVQVEVDDVDALREALSAGVRSVLLDNFGLEELREAVARCRAEREYVFVEASGGLTLETVRAVAQTGVDAVAIGAVTHSAPALDIALDFDLGEG